MQVYNRLIENYGDLPLKPRREPMYELISTMLSHRTTERNEALAFDRMWERFESWEAIRDAPADELAQAISPATFPESKAPNIQKALAQIIEERGEASIDFLEDMSAEEGLKWLMALPGVGIKTASLVLLFCFSKPRLPVDTHVHRVSKRIGLIALKANVNAAHKLLQDILPADPHVLYNFHVAMLRHGQQICTWDMPWCADCPLADLCDWYAENVDY